MRLKMELNKIGVKRIEGNVFEMVSKYDRYEFRYVGVLNKHTIKGFIDYIKRSIQNDQ